MIELTKEQQQAVGGLEEVDPSLYEFEQPDPPLAAHILRRLQFSETPLKKPREQ